MLEEDYRLSEEATNSNLGISHAAPFPREPSPPAAPTNLVATAVSSNQIDLTWQDNTSNENGFIVKCKAGTAPNAPFVDVFTTGPIASSYPDTEVKPNTTTPIECRRFATPGVGVASNDAVVTTLPPVAAPQEVTGHPQRGSCNLIQRFNNQRSKQRWMRRESPFDLQIPLLTLSTF